MDVSDGATEGFNPIPEIFVINHFGLDQTVQVLH